jgi:hypothetical protein
VVYVIFLWCLKKRKTCEFMKGRKQPSQIDYLKIEICNKTAYELVEKLKCTSLHVVQPNNEEKLHLIFATNNCMITFRTEIEQPVSSTSLQSIIHLED